VLHCSFVQQGTASPCLSPLGSPLWISSWIGLYVLGIGLCILSIGLYFLSPVGSLPAWNTCISMSRAANHISHTYSSIQEKGDDFIIPAGVSDVLSLCCEIDLVRWRLADHQNRPSETSPDPDLSGWQAIFRLPPAGHQFIIIHKIKITIHGAEVHCISAVHHSRTSFAFWVRGLRPTMLGTNRRSTNNPSLTDFCNRPAHHHDQILLICCC
jgi:hypothetical protein